MYVELDTSLVGRKMEATFGTFQIFYFVSRKKKYIVLCLPFGLGKDNPLLEHIIKILSNLGTKRVGDISSPLMVEVQNIVTQNIEDLGLGFFYSSIIVERAKL